MLPVSSGHNNSFLHGIMAIFEHPEDLLIAVRRARGEGYRAMDAYTPMPVEGLADALDFRSNSVPRIVFLGGLFGAAGGYGLMYWITVIAYPLNVGSRPLHSWPAYIPITFECMVLLASFAAVFGMLALNRLPQPYHPVFNAPQFERASRDRFVLCLEARDPKFDAEDTRRFLESLHPEEVIYVPA